MQLSSLADANKILVAKLKKSERSTSDSLHEEGIGDDVSCLSSKTGATNGSCGEASEAVRESSSRNFEVRCHMIEFSLCFVACKNRNGKWGICISFILCVCVLAFEGLASHVHQYSP